MIRGVLFLLIAVAVIALVMSLVRRSRRSPEDEASPSPKSANVTGRAVPALPAPAVDAKPVPSVDEVLHKLNEVAFARNLTTSTGGHDEIIAAVTAALETVANEPRYSPRRPMLLPQLVKAVNDTDTSRRELSTMISKDPSLVGSLLKLANSQYYRTNSQPVESVDRAVAVIGTEGIRSLIAAALVQPVFRVSGGEFAQFPEVIWDHTFLAANAAETYAAVVVNSDPFAAQLLALVNGLGAIVVFRVAIDQYDEHPGFRPDAATIVSLLDTHASRVARTIAASWELSGRILAALEDQVSGGMASDPTPLGRALKFGRFIAALAILRNKGLIDEETAKASLQAGGGSGAHFERIWNRLTGKPPVQPERPEKSMSDWKT
ncbi:MAG: HDOD domain-containing protein [Gammaproteobacteria bacterium]